MLLLQIQSDELMNSGILNGELNIQIKMMNQLKHEFRGIL